MKALGIILAGGNNNRMKGLTHERAASAMPVAGSFKGIDFALSSMTNSHIQTVAVLTQYNARSLNEHLSSSNGGILAESREDYICLPLPSLQKTAIGTEEQLMQCTRILNF